MYPVISVFGRQIPTYGLCMATALCVAGALAFLRVKRRGGDTDNLLILAAVSVGCALAGAWLLYVVVTYSWDVILRDIREGSFLILRSGGLVYYGGLIGGIAGFLLGAGIIREKRLDLLCDAVVPCIPLGHAIGRVGCYFAGCCYGLDYDGPCALHILRDGAMVSVFPIQLAEAALNALLAAALMILAGKKAGKLFVLYVYLLAYGLLRFTLEFFRGDGVRGIYAGLSTSQWISLALALIGAALLLRRRMDRGRRAAA